MESAGVPGEYGLVFAVLVLCFVGGVISLFGYAAVKLSLKNPEDIP
jgi:hypothetical protein